MNELEMMNKLTEEFDLVDLSALMVEAISTTFDEMMEMVIGDNDNINNITKFNNAFWKAIAQANIE